jgi:hypothetical protein
LPDEDGGVAVVVVEVLGGTVVVVEVVGGGVLIGGVVVVCCLRRPPRTPTSPAPTRRLLLAGRRRPSVERRARPAGPPARLDRILLSAASSHPPALRYCATASVDELRTAQTAIVLSLVGALQVGLCVVEGRCASAAAASRSAGSSEARRRPPPPLPSTTATGATLPPMGTQTDARAVGSIVATARSTSSVSWVPTVAVR